MVNLKNIVEKSELFVRNSFYNNTTLLYHNFDHTLRVVNYIETLALGEQLSEDDQIIVTVAAYFHDVAYSINKNNHEQLSAEMCEHFLTSEGCSKDFISSVVSCILSTKPSYIPKSLLEKIIRDADSGHITHKEFLNYSDLLRREEQLSRNTSIITQIEWINENLEYLNTHIFYTNFAKKNWQEAKDKLRFKILKEKDKLEKSIAKDEIPEKGIETAFRVALKNHMKLSDIADAKANILLSVNAIIISVALSTLIPKLDNPSNAHLIWPAISLISFSVIAIVFSIFSTRPKVTQGSFTRDDINKRKVNLLFFGNFHSVSLDDFKYGMHEMMKDKDYLYDSMITDLYFLGKVLHKKYNLLRVTYNIFLVGLLISIAVFAIMLKNAV